MCWMVCVAWLETAGSCPAYLRGRYFLGRNPAGLQVKERPTAASQWRVCCLTLQQTARKACSGCSLSDSFKARVISDHQLLLLRSASSSTE